jgi:hypothetical protein
VRDQVSHPYSTTGRITVLYILIITFFDILEDKTSWTDECTWTIIIKETFNNLIDVDIY